MRTGLHWLVVIALCVQAFLSAGVMLVPSGQDGEGVSVVICTGHGPMTVELDADGKPVPPQNKPSKADACPFATASTLGIAGEPVVLAQTVEFASVVYRLDAIRFSATPEPGAHSARGPPLILS